MGATGAEGADIRGEAKGAPPPQRGACQHAVARERESMHRPPSEARGTGTVPLDKPRNYLDAAKPRMIFTKASTTLGDDLRSGLGGISGLLPMAGPPSTIALATC